jgi:predicted dehydrogenase
VSGRRPLGVAVIGCGAIAHGQHLPNLRRLRGARLVAIADPDAEARRRAGAGRGVRVFTDAAELLAWPEVEAVVIAAPTASHAELAGLALAAGRPIYLEKPIAAGADEAARLLAAARGAPAAVTVGFHLRFQPLYRQARAWIRSGRLGEVVALRGLFAEPLAGAAATGWRTRREAGGGVLLDLASHQLDLVRWLLDDELATVESARRDGDGRLAALTLATRRGARFQGLFAYGAGPLERLEVVGDQATLAIDRHRGTATCAAPRRSGRYGSRRRFVAPTAATLALRLRRLLQPSWEPAFAAALAAWVETAREPVGEPAGTPALATLADGAASLAAVLAVERAAAATPIEIVPLDDAPPPGAARG